MSKSAKLWAKALYELSVESPKEAKKFTANLVSQLIKSGQRSQLERVVYELENLQNQAQGLQPVYLESARPVEMAVKNLIVDALKQKKLLKKEAVFVEKINADLLGGVRLRIDDLLLDASYAGVFKQFKRQLKRG